MSGPGGPAVIHLPSTGEASPTCPTCRSSLGPFGCATCNNARAAPAATVQNQEKVGGLIPRNVIDVEFLNAQLAEQKKLLQQYNDIRENHEMVVVIGKSDTGKSTTVNYVLGAPFSLKLLPDSRRKRLYCDDVKAAEIGYKRGSCTDFAQFWTGEEGKVYCDPPGFMDTRGLSYEIANAIKNRYTLLSMAKFVHPVVLIDYRSLDAENGMGLKEFLIGLTTFVPQSALTSTLFLFSHAPNEDECDSGTVLEEIRALKEAQHFQEHERVMEILTYIMGLLEKHKETNLLIVRPLNREKRKELQELMWSLDGVDPHTFKLPLIGDRIRQLEASCLQQTALATEAFKRSDWGSVKRHLLYLRSLVDAIGECSCDIASILAQCLAGIVEDTLARFQRAQQYFQMDQFAQAAEELQCRELDLPSVLKGTQAEDYHEKEHQLRQMVNQRAVSLSMCGPQQETRQDFLQLGQDLVKLKELIDHLSPLLEGSNRTLLEKSHKTLVASVHQIFTTANRAIDQGMYHITDGASQVAFNVLLDALSQATFESHSQLPDLQKILGDFSLLYKIVIKALEDSLSASQIQFGKAYEDLVARGQLEDRSTCQNIFGQMGYVKRSLMAHLPEFKIYDELQRLVRKSHDTLMIETGSNLDTFCFSEASETLRKLKEAHLVTGDQDMSANFTTMVKKISSSMLACVNEVKKLSHDKNFKDLAQRLTQLQEGSRLLAEFNQSSEQFEAEYAGQVEELKARSVAHVSWILKVLGESTAIFPTCRSKSGAIDETKAEAFSGNRRQWARFPEHMRSFDSLLPLRAHVPELEKLSEIIGALTLCVQVLCQSLATVSATRGNELALDTLLSSLEVIRQALDSLQQTTNCKLWADEKQSPISLLDATKEAAEKMIKSHIKDLRNEYVSLSITINNETADPAISKLIGDLDTIQQVLDALVRMALWLRREPQCSEELNSLVTVLRTLLIQVSAECYQCIASGGDKIRRAQILMDLMQRLSTVTVGSARMPADDANEDQQEHKSLEIKNTIDKLAAEEHKKLVQAFKEKVDRFDADVNLYLSSESYEELVTTMQGQAQIPLPTEKEKYTRALTRITNKVSQEYLRAKRICSQASTDLSLVDASGVDTFCEGFEKLMSARPLTKLIGSIPLWSADIVEQGLTLGDEMVNQVQCALKACNWQAADRAFKLLRQFQTAMPPENDLRDNLSKRVLEVEATVQSFFQNPCADLHKDLVENENDWQSVQDRLESLKALTLQTSTLIFRKHDPKLPYRACVRSVEQHLKTMGEDIAKALRSEDTEGAKTKIAIFRQFADLVDDKIYKDKSEDFKVELASHCELFISDGKIIPNPDAFRTKLEHFARTYPLEFRLQLESYKAKLLIRISGLLTQFDEKQFDLQIGELEIFFKILRGLGDTAATECWSKVAAVERKFQAYVEHLLHECKQAFNSKDLVKLDSLQYSVPEIFERFVTVMKYNDVTKWENWKVQHDQTVKNVTGAISGVVDDLKSRSHVIDDFTLSKDFDCENFDAYLSAQKNSEVALVTCNSPLKYETSINSVRTKVFKFDYVKEWQKACDLWLNNKDTNGLSALSLSLKVLLKLRNCKHSAALAIQEYCKRGEQDVSAKLDKWKADTLINYDKAKSSLENDSEWKVVNQQIEFLTVVGAVMDQYPDPEQPVIQKIVNTIEERAGRIRGDNSVAADLARELILTYGLSLRVNHASVRKAATKATGQLLDMVKAAGKVKFGALGYALGESNNPTGQAIVQHFHHFAAEREQNDQLSRKGMTYAAVLAQIKCMPPTTIANDRVVEQIKLFQKLYKENCDEYFYQPVQALYDRFETDRGWFWHGPTKDSNKFIMLLAAIFSAFTIQHRFEEEQVRKIPWESQVVALLRALDTDEKEPWFPWGRSKATPPNHLLQIRTGEGKSIILGVLSVLLALCGFHVKCVCYSNYLSARDEEDFKSLFIGFKVKDCIRYSTIADMTNFVILQGGDMRAAMLKLLTGNEEKQEKRALQPKKPEILLLDEADTLFSPDFYGKFFIPSVKLQHPLISALQKHIFASKASSPTFAQMSQSTQYKAVADHFCKGGHAAKKREIFESQLHMMLQDLKSFELPKYAPKLDRTERKLSYDDGTGIYSTKIAYGYNTTFMYIKTHHEAGDVIDAATLEDYLGLIITCGKFSYAEIPKPMNHFERLIGVTGTLEWLSNYEKKVVEEEYKVTKFTYVPSMYNKKEVLAIQSDIFVDNDLTVYEQRIKDDILTRVAKGQPVVVYFETDARMLAWHSSAHGGTLVTHEFVRSFASSSDVQFAVDTGTSRGKVTLFPRILGRGLNFVCENSAVEEAGGLHVVITYLPSEESEQVQVIGRTARKDKKGTCSIILFEDDLIAKYTTAGYSPDARKKAEESKTLYPFLHELRVKTCNAQTETRSAQVAAAKVEHVRTLTFQKQCANINANQGTLLDYLSSINRFHLKVMALDASPVRPPRTTQGEERCPTAGGRAHFTGGLVGYEFSEAGVSKAFVEDGWGEFVGVGRFKTCRAAFPKAIAATFDGICIDAGTRVTIYSKPDFKGDILYDRAGPAVVCNSLWQNSSLYRKFAEELLGGWPEPLQLVFPNSAREFSASNMHLWADGSCVITDGEPISATLAACVEEYSAVVTHS